MHTIEIETLGRSGSDGALHVDIPVGEPSRNRRVTIQAELVERPHGAEWPEGYFERLSVPGPESGNAISPCPWDRLPACQGPGKTRRRCKRIDRLEAYPTGHPGVVANPPLGVIIESGH